jgi:hypothetical protein
MILKVTAASRKPRSCFLVWAEWLACRANLAHQKNAQMVDLSYLTRPADRSSRLPVFPPTTSESGRPNRRQLKFPSHHSFHRADKPDFNPI